MNKVKHNHHKNFYFLGFLIAYGILLVFHVATLPFATPWFYLIFVTGILIAIASHTRHGNETLILLLIHMGLEWWERSHHTGTYSTQELILHGIHIIFDVVFLWEEVRTHFKNPTIRFGILATVTLGIASMFFIAQSHGIHIPALPIDEHANTPSLFPTTLETMVLGGMIGCIISHIFLPKKTSS